MDYIAIDTEDKHVLDNRIFHNREDAEKLAKEYHDQCTSFVSNEYSVVSVKDCGKELKFGSFPYNNILYYAEPESEIKDVISEMQSISEITAEMKKLGEKYINSEQIEARHCADYLYRFAQRLEELRNEDKV